ncbi:MAG: molybdopterin-guanine dinucleotide biosynthesis protein B [Pseudomonadota bacterium]
MSAEHAPPLLAFVAASGTGKTTLLEQLIPLLRSHGLHLAVIKHTHHDFDIDQPGKDSYRMRAAGAQQVMVASRRRWALLTEHPDGRAEPCLEELVAALDRTTLDLILVEGFKHEAVTKIELHRPTLGKPPLFPHDPRIIAVACDAPPNVPISLPLLDLNDPSAIAAFVLRHIGRQ